MGKSIVLRVLEGTVLSPELSQALRGLLPDYNVEYFQEQPNYHRSIERRIHSFHDSFLFILDAYPLDPQFTHLTKETLIRYADECKEECHLQKEATLNELHEVLEKYTAKLINILALGWSWPKGQEIKESIACLNEAEQYLLMSKGRPDLATLIPVKLSTDIEYILLLDETLPPYYDLWLKELELIKAHHFPKTAIWFRDLLAFQQTYFCNLSIEKITPSEIKKDFAAFIEVWKSNKEISLNFIAELTNIYRQILPLPHWFNSLNIAHQKMVKVLSKDPAQIESLLIQFKLMLDKGLSTDHSEFINKLVQIPQWYWALSYRQQCFLEHVLKNAMTLKDAVSFLSSRHRTLPAPANFAVHSLYTINTKSEIHLLYNKRYRSSHIASRDTLITGHEKGSFSDEVQQRHSDSNFAKVSELATSKQPILMQTLISPIHALETIPSGLKDQLPELPPDLDLYKMARGTIARSPYNSNTFQHNHPLNLAKFYYYTPANDSDSLLLLAKSEEHLPQYPDLQVLMDEYRRVLESPIGTATFFDYDGRELFLSSLEQLIILTMNGYSYGSCVSGKDRKAVELMHTDAMILYKEKYGEWPKFGSPKETADRINFVAIIATLYLSRHQHEHAGQNAPGSEGIKTPSMYWPKDVCNEINRCLGSENGLDYDDRLATNNEVKNIQSSKELKAKLLPSDKLLAQLITKQLGEPVCTKLYDALSALINEKRQFQIHKNWTLGLFDETAIPLGIQDIKSVMHAEGGGKNNVQRLARIFEIALNRPLTNSTRTSATSSVYMGIRGLCYPSTAGKVFLPNMVEKEWLKLFEESKETHSSVGAAAETVATP